MAQKAIRIELLDMQKRAEQTAQNIKQISRNLYSEQRMLRQLIEEYNAKRVVLFQQELQQRGLTWCTLCAEKIEVICGSEQQEVIPESEAELILLTGREMYSCGYENSCYGFRDFFKLHRVCPACREKAFDKHGIHGTYGSLAKNQTSFYAFRVEKRDDGYYARRFGDWEKLDEEKCVLPDPPRQLIDQLAQEWNIPPRISLDRDENLVIHEQWTAVKAV